MLQGSMVALVTPMTADGELDWPALHKLVEWQIEQGTQGIVPMGTTGEPATLSMEDHLKVIAAVVDQVNGRIPVIGGTGANSTAEAVHLTQGAKDAGVDACLLVCPYYNKPTQEGLFRHYEYVAKAVDIPQILYNVPSRTAVDMKDETILRLAKVKNIIGVKEATGDMARAKHLLAAAPQGFSLISGDDATSLALLLLGGHGTISVTANVAPRLVASMCEHALRGEVEQARADFAKLTPLNSALFLETNPIPAKWALQAMGMIGPGIRLPMTPLSEQFYEPVRAALKAAGISV